MDEQPAPQPFPLLLTIRFTANIPDLLLTIPNPTNTTPLSLKGKIRKTLPPDLSTHRLRLIHSGKVLPDTSTLTLALRLPSPPPPPPRSPLRNEPPNNDKSKSKDKGKAPLRSRPPSPPPAPAQRVYIHCSIGDALQPTELAAEADAALASEQPSRAPTPSGQPDTEASASSSAPSTITTTTTPAPRGFDRLLGAGFAPSEIAALRSQFLDLQAHTHTPDTMPSAAELRVLEDRWIDESTAPDGGVDGGGGGGGGVDDGEGGGLEDMLWGNVMGFFWPLGAVVWLLREEGVWSKRRQIAVFTGLLVNVAFSVLRVTS